MSNLVGAKVLCACVIGTRPEAIKMAPVIKFLESTTWAKPITVTTGQQGSLLNLALSEFEIEPDVDIPHVGLQSVGANLARITSDLDGIFGKLEPAIVLGQGDTTTALAASIAAFYRRIPFVHVEAGLRSGDVYSPFPEEYHRKMIAVTAALHCAPTEKAAQHLRGENVCPDRIHVTGNTVIDALLDTAKLSPATPVSFPKASKTILLTAHRRENFGAPMEEALLAVRSFLDSHSEVSVFFPVHPNPTARDMAIKTLGDHPQAVLADPLSYRDNVAAIQKSWIVLTDSGGLQEEAPALGKPVFVLRDRTERPEAVEAGVVRIIGTQRENIVGSLTEILKSPSVYERMATPIFPYGTGDSASKIVKLLPSII